MKTWTVAVSENANISPNEAIKWCVDESNDFLQRKLQSNLLLKR